VYWSSGKSKVSRKSIKSSALNLPRLRVRRENAAWHDVRERDVREQREVPHMNLTEEGGREERERENDGNEKRPPVMGSLVRASAVRLAGRRSAGGPPGRPGFPGGGGLARC